MYALIVYLVLQGQIQTVQIDTFSNKEKCEHAYFLMDEVYQVLEKQTGTKAFAYCIQKD